MKTRYLLPTLPKEISEPILIQQVSQAIWASLVTVHWECSEHRKKLMLMFPSILVIQFSDRLRNPECFIMKTSVGHRMQQQVCMLLPMESLQLLTRTG